MAKRATKKKRVAKNAKKKVAARTKTKKAGARRPDARRPVKKKREMGPAAASSRLGVITHTELASADPGATRTWCREVLGWKFGEAMPTPAGPYHMWRFEAQGTGGGIRANNPPEAPGSIPYCEVADIQLTYAKALDGGAIEMLRPEQLPGGMGWIAIVAAPGGVPIGFWAMR
jgi:predicted enzyme related to lactoylglutathione lyase